MTAKEETDLNVFLLLILILSFSFHFGETEYRPLLSAHLYLSDGQGDVS